MLLLPKLLQLLQLTITIIIIIVKCLVHGTIVLSKLLYGTEA